MTPKLARTLIERHVIQHGTVLDAYHSAKGISCQCDAAVRGSFRLTGAQADKEWVYFNTIMPDSKEAYRIRCDYVIAIDGMPLTRIAEAQQLTEDGEDAKIKRRKKGEISDKDMNS